METETKADNRTKRTNNRGALLIAVDGERFDVPYNGGGLDELRRLIKCEWVEAVQLRGPLAGLTMWCDDEGKLRNNHKVNAPASILYRHLGGDYIAGRVVILANDPNTGDIAALSRHQLSLAKIYLLAAMYAYEKNRGEEIKATGPNVGIYFV